jgi:lipopolysaccharide biosynthesis glycosyltransferase
MKTLKIFIGYDPKEAVAFHVLSHSLLERSSKPISIVPINLRNLKNLYSRQHDQRQSNEFSFSRFLVPYLCNYEGIGVYMDCDMLALGDISTVLNDIDEKHALSVVKHDYESKVKVKYLGNKQYSYPRKKLVLIYSLELCPFIE